MEIVFDKGMGRIGPNIMVIFALVSGKHKQYFKRMHESERSEGYHHATSNIRAELLKRLRPHIDQLLNALERQVESGYIQPATEKFPLELDWYIE